MTQHWALLKIEMISVWLILRVQKIQVLTVTIKETKHYLMDQHKILGKMELIKISYRMLPVH